MDPTHEIYCPHSGDVIGTAVYIKDGSISITIGDMFAGIFDKFETWNLGKSYKIRKTFKLVNHDEDFDLFDLYNTEDKQIVDNYGNLDAYYTYKPSDN